MRQEVACLLWALVHLSFADNTDSSEIDIGKKTKIKKINETILECYIYHYQPHSLLSTTLHWFFRFIRKVGQKFENRDLFSKF